MHNALVPESDTIFEQARCSPRALRAKKQSQSRASVERRNAQPLPSYPSRNLIQSLSLIHTPNQDVCHAIRFFRHMRDNTSSDF